MWVNVRYCKGTFQHWLKPGGKVLITVYGMGHGTLSAKFQAYVEKRKYFLKTLEEMVEVRDFRLQFSFICQGTKAIEERYGWNNVETDPCIIIEQYYI